MTGIPQLSRCLRQAIRADAMTECRIAAFGDVLLDTHPDLVLVSDFLAVHAGGEDPFETLHAILQSDDTLRYVQLGAQLIRIEGF